MVNSRKVRSGKPRWRHLITKLDNLVGVIDGNRLQIDGKVSEVMNVEPLEDKYRSFGWGVIRIKGHDMQQVVDALDTAKASTDSLSSSSSKL